MKDKVSFFLGCETPQGFYSLFRELYDAYSGWRCYILKGGPGTGKSTFMRRVAETAENCGCTVEYINCASDPGSLDAVILKEKKVCFVDGTAPHVMEPVLPGVCEQLIDLGEYWNSDIISKKSAEIISLQEECKLCHSRAVRFLKGAAVLQHDTDRLIEAYTDTEKIICCADRLVKREIPRIKGKTGVSTRRILCAPTPDGIYFHGNTLQALGKRTVGITGHPGVAGTLLEQISTCVRARGHDVILCPSYLYPEQTLMGVIVPSAGLSFVLLERAAADLPVEKTLHTSRFVQTAELSGHKSRIRFNSRLYDELMQQAIAALFAAREKHTELEKLYMPAMNYKKCEKRCDAVLREIL